MVIKTKKFLKLVIEIISFVEGKEYTLEKTKEQKGSKYQCYETRTITNVFTIKCGDEEIEAFRVFVKGEEISWGIYHEFYGNSEYKQFCISEIYEVLGRLAMSFPYLSELIGVFNVAVNSDEMDNFDELAELIKTTVGIPAKQKRNVKGQ